MNGRGLSGHGASGVVSAQPSFTPYHWRPCPDFVTGSAFCYPHPYIPLLAKSPASWLEWLQGPDTKFVLSQLDYLKETIKFLDSVNHLILILLMYSEK